MELLNSAWKARLSYELSNSIVVRVTETRDNLEPEDELRNVNWRWKYHLHLHEK